MSQGVIYIASGKKFTDEAVQSAGSLKRAMPNIKITLFSTENVKSKNFENITPISENRIAAEYPHMAKQIYMYQSPYKHTLYLDTDTYVCGDISELFALMERFDIAVSQAELRASYKVDDVPESFPDPNSGVILFRKSPEVEKIFSDWLILYRKYIREIKSKWVMDQAALREALYMSKARIATLAPEYNCRFVFPVYLDGPVKILHGRYPDMEYVAREINKKKKIRVFILGIGSLSINDKHPLATLAFQRLMHVLKRRSRR